MVWIDPCDSFSSSSSRVRTRLSADKRRRDEAEVARLLAHRRHLVLDAAAVLAALARHLGVQEDDVQQREDGDEADVAGERAGRARAARPVRSASTASKPMAAAASGRPTASRWKVTRKLTTA